MTKKSSLHSIVEDYYGKTLSSNADLQTNACCSPDEMEGYLKPILKNIHTEIHTTFYGCGSPIPLGLQGKTVLDLGCGSGRDCFLLSALVGPRGKVIGVDMTEEQLQIGQKYIDYHTEKFGLPEPNVSFRHGLIEDLKEAGVEDSSVDIVISNCVINLSPQKERVFSEIMRVLRPGGELYFSDIFADRRIPVELASDPVLLGECLSGALYFEDFRRVLSSLGVSDVRTVSSRILGSFSPAIEEKIGMVQFSSMTVRAFQLSGLEDRCEDYGQVATYLGSIPQAKHAFVLDEHHVFQTGKPYPVCGNTASMLTQTRYLEHFHVTGDRSTHFGLFDTDSSSAWTRERLSPRGACC